MNLNFQKNNGLIPVIIQDYITLQILMLGYMNAEAFNKTLQEKKVTFFSRTKNRLWTKGATSGNFLVVKDIQIDCDYDTILIKAIPEGPTCHTGLKSCFKEETHKGFLYQLENLITNRVDNNDKNSYTNKLIKQGINKVAQKVGEEAVELIIEAKDTNNELFKNEAADLLYHFLILLKAKNTNLQEIEKILAFRNVKS
ncbi:bifunctional phosphoribosyl-AMP cyclohydrolase/phosphoribosyl-ATP diphosphatase HisIE [Flavobacterium oreochromis]|uniref:Histidine biosynthesis bifunctional protein HisIE n=1 Tax=Flavobacterium columnare TaxID=996 RepID=A0A246G7V9_9FLAO|nr:bifunctional phosphoribosyl-AMP cyclohydrolase/phosphoribosyl-ATP diphosphatase HisIE [Flavobacterium oreochromis]OWP74690.1 bifunctional phosphoribosyl-AMP cyclohydrolase/phosphoribosyl-ATP diphosphatase [Flavobacterium oreochromis]